MSARARAAAACDPADPACAGRAYGEPDYVSLAGDIRRLGNRLRRPDTLRHPQVSAALAQLDRQLAGALGPGSGKHRLQADPAYEPERARLRWSPDCKPDPRAATTPAEFLGALRQYRAWSGDTPFRRMAATVHFEVAHSTMCSALRGGDLPALKVVRAIVAGCGGGADDQEAFTAAWRRINAASLTRSGA